MARLTIEMPTDLRDSTPRTAADGGPAAASEPLRSDGVDESVRAFVRWVDCWAE